MNDPNWRQRAVERRREIARNLTGEDRAAWDVGEIKLRLPEDAAPFAVDISSIFSFLGETPASPPRQLIKNLFPAEGVAVTGGQSGAGKTFIEIYKAV